MKIIKEGEVTNLLKPKTFTCSICGCIFEASKNEYSVFNDCTSTTYFKAICPMEFCQAIVYGDEE